jgi:hypothetical protein
MIPVATVPHDHAVRALAMPVAATTPTELNMLDIHLAPLLQMVRCPLGPRLAAACMLAAALAACGGGDEAGPAPLQAKAEAFPRNAMVLFEGCVVDEHFVPHESVAVRVLAEDGRLLGNARSGRAGEFVLRLPAGARVVLQVDADGGESMNVLTGTLDQRAANCLQARAG